MRNLIQINNYKTLIFDCDGVVLNSNKVKTQAFYEATKQFGEQPAKALVDYHVQNGGISRYAKFEYFITKILLKDMDQNLFADLLLRFSESVHEGLMACEVSDGLAELRDKTLDSKWLIVSGGDQDELRDVFAKRGLDKLFDGGIFGSPDTKEAILNREEESFNIMKPAIFLGDSKYDHEASFKSKLDFVFIFNWTEFKDWRNYCMLENLVSKPKLIDLL